VLFSTDEIGHLIEEPFGTQSERESKSGVLANVMSRRQLAQVISSMRHY
jgi:predicted membrane chloride channel (bestrophin family)